MHIYDQLRDIKIYCFPTLTDHDVSADFSNEHFDCDPTDRIHANLDNIIDSIAMVLDPAMATHLDHQAQLTGIYEQTMRAREIAPKKNK